MLHLFEPAFDVAALDGARPVRYRQAEQEQDLPHRRDRVRQDLLAGFSLLDVAVGQIGQGSLAARQLLRGAFGGGIALASPDGALGGTARDVRGVERPAGRADLEGLAWSDPDPSQPDRPGPAASGCVIRLRSCAADCAADGPRVPGRTPAHGARDRPLPGLQGSKSDCCNRISRLSARRICHRHRLLVRWWPGPGALRALPGPFPVPTSIPTTRWYGLSGVGT